MKKKALIIGGGGFVGRHLADCLLETEDYAVTSTALPGEIRQQSGVETVALDICDSEQVCGLLHARQPDCVFHLAAQSSVALAWQEPGLTVDVNIKGGLNLLEALRSMEMPPRTLLVGSSEEYGMIRPEEALVTEANALRPANIYAATKVCQGMIGKIYADAYRLPVIMVRAFNHIGPGQSETFVIPSFCRQVADIEAGRVEPILRVGNLSARRDFTDVRDVVRAYTALIERGHNGEFYNVGSGETTSIQAVLDVLLEHARVPIKVQVDSSRYRPVETPEIRADINKIRTDTGWSPRYALKSVVLEVLNEWREKSGMLKV